MRIRRTVLCGVAVLAVGGLVTGPAALGATDRPSAPVTVGHIAYLTAKDTVELATVESNGTTTGAKQIGPVTLVVASDTVQVDDLMASGDGAWLAWQEEVFKHNGDLVKTVLVLRHESDGQDFALNTVQSPLGFAGDQLVTSSANATRRVSVQPTMHLIKVNDHAFPLAAYPHGVVDGPSYLAPKGPARTWRVRLTSFAGTHTTLHDYVLGPTNYRNPDAAWVSADGKRLVIERGNHQDFGGLGPSSLADEFVLGAGHARSQLGHYGTDKQAWRIGSVSFSGSSDSVWAMWERLTKTGATSVVARREHGSWTLIAGHGIAVAGNQTGYVIVQPGKLVLTNPDVQGYDTVPTRHAELRHSTSSVSLNAEGTTFVWVSS